MALSSKKIIEYINSNDGFSASKIINELVTGSDAVNRKKKVKNKKKSSQQKDINRIHETIQIMLLLGYIEKKSKKFIKSEDFMDIGVIKINPRSDSSVELPYNTIWINKKGYGNAQTGDKVRVKIHDLRHGKIYGFVDKVVERQKEEYYARAVKNSGNYTTLELLDMPGSPKVVCDENLKFSSIFKVSLSSKVFNMMPVCEIIYQVKTDDDQLDFNRICLKHNLPEMYKKSKDEQFFIDNIPESELKNRQDLTNLYTVTIDGKYAKDFDDAVSLEQKNDNYILYVHIADVSAYVSKNSFLDRESFKRSNSYYLGNRVIPMLPEVLSNKLCSLVEGVDRLALTAILTYDKNGNLKKYKFTRAKIISDKRLTYEIADELITKNKTKDPSYNLVKGLYDFTTILKKNRIQNGRIDLNLTENVLIYEDEIFTEIKSAQRLKSHSIIEECMLSANEAVSLQLRIAKVPSLYRIHEDISPENILIMKKFLNRLGIHLKNVKDTGKIIQKIISEVKDKEYEQIVNFIILRSMMQAQYSPEPLGHFGLGFKDYTHFTSPIRRYPDLIVHRCLKTFIDNSDKIYKTKELDIIGEQTSKMERVAQKAERDLFKIKACRIMEDHIGEVFSGIISSISKFGIYVALDEIPVEGMIFLKNMDDDYYIVNEEEFKVTGRRNGKTFLLGDKLMVKVIKADHLLMHIDLEYINLL